MGVVSRSREKEAQTGKNIESGHSATMLGNLVIPECSWMFLDFHLNSGGKILELVPYMGYITPSCVIIKLPTFNCGREAVWCSEESSPLEPESFQFQGGQSYHPVVWLWTSWFSVDLRFFCFFFFPSSKMTGWAGLSLMCKAALQHSVTDF